MARTYSSQEVRSILRITQRRLDYWDELGIVRPSANRQRGSKGTGRGQDRRYTYQDLFKLKVVKELRATGLSLQKIRRALRALGKRALNNDPLLEMLVTDGQRFERRRLDGTVEDLLGDGQLLFAAFSLFKMDDELRERVIRLEQETSEGAAVRAAAT